MTGDHWAGRRARREGQQPINLERALTAGRSRPAPPLTSSMFDACAPGDLHGIDPALTRLSAANATKATRNRPGELVPDPARASPPREQETSDDHHRTHTKAQALGRRAHRQNRRLPEHANWDEARLAWNLAVDQQPAAVVFPESAQDVIAAVELARAFELRVTAQGTGHNAAPLGPLEDTVLVKTERMRGIKIDPEAQIARIDAGVRSVELVEAAAQHGLAPLAGSSPDVGVVGYTLGGGLSWFGRKHGLAASHVHAIELVTADGRLVRADHEHEPDLFWALRGGGGSFGIVTALELRLIPVREAYAGILWWPIERDREVLHAWAELTRHELPDELTTVGRYLRLPTPPDIPEPIRGKSFVVVEAIHLGEPKQADELLAPLRALGPGTPSERSGRTGRVARLPPRACLKPGRGALSVGVIVERGHQRRLSTVPGCAAFVA